MKYEAILAYSSEFSVRRMCDVLGLSSGNYYAWKRRRGMQSSRKIEKQALTAKVEKVFLESDRTYGYRMVKKQLEKEGCAVSEYMVRRIMRENGFYPETQKKYRPYRNGRSGGSISPNILDRNFDVESRNRVWAGDITYIKTNIGWVYLAVVMDLYNREIIGWSISRSIDAELVKSALGNAIARSGASGGVIFHSDRGVQYSSRTYRNMMEENGITGSMSRTGCPYDNSCVESFFATLKKERIYRREYDIIEDVRKDMFQYIELFYNRRRMHTKLDYMSPVEYRLKHAA